MNVKTKHGTILGISHSDADKSCFFYLQQSDDDVSQFDSKFTRQTPVDSPDDSTLSESANQVFLVSLSDIPRVVLKMCCESW